VAEIYQNSTGIAATVTQYAIAEETINPLILDDLKESKRERRKLMRFPKIFQIQTGQTKNAIEYIMTSASRFNIAPPVLKHIPSILQVCTDGYSPYAYAGNNGTTTTRSQYPISAAAFINPMQPPNAIEMKNNDSANRVTSHMGRILQ
jgi:hypothetical protein